MKNGRMLRALAILLALLMPALALAETAEVEVRPEEALEALSDADVVNAGDEAAPELGDIALGEPPDEAPAEEPPEAPEEAEDPVDGAALFEQEGDETDPEQALANVPYEELFGDYEEDAACANAVGGFPKTLKMGLRETFVLDATNGAGGQVAYRSSAPKVVSVNASTGKLAALKTGKATIAAMNENKEIIYCTVKVLGIPGGVKLSKASLVLNPGATERLGVKLPRKTASAKLAFISTDGAVASVDESGVVTALKPGETTVTVTTYNNKRASCRVIVLDGEAPTSLTLSPATATLGKGETLQLAAGVNEGAAAMYTFSSGNGRVTVDENGLVTAKKKGAVKVTVATHNGLTQTCAIRVLGVPGGVKLTKTALRMQVGGSETLTAAVPDGTSSAFTWKSSDDSVASVDQSGNVTAHKIGTAKIGVSTYNGHTDTCTVQVLSKEDFEKPDAALMAARIRGNASIGAKRDALANIVELLVNNGFEPAFAAGVAANVKSEGSYGFFESSRYISNPMARPRYFAYLDGGEYYKNGVLNTVYLGAAEYKKYEAPEGVTKALRLAEGKAPEKYYWNKYAKKFAWEVNLDELEKLLDYLEQGGWVGKFGLGITQWTGGRTKNLVKVYRKHAGTASTITQAQVVAAENEMIMAELKTSYAFVYNNWKSENAGKLSGAAAAYSAGSIFCLKYEVPANKEAAAKTRGNSAKEIYAIMMG